MNLTKSKNNIDVVYASTGGYREIIDDINNDNHTNIIDFVEFSSLGNAQDFGDLTGLDLDGSNNLNSTATISDCHGGLGGY